MIGRKAFIIKVTRRVSLGLMSFSFGSFNRWIGFIKNKQQKPTGNNLVALASNPGTQEAKSEGAPRVQDSRLAYDIE